MYVLYNYRLLNTLITNFNTEMNGITSQLSQETSLLIISISINMLNNSYLLIYGYTKMMAKQYLYSNDIYTTIPVNLINYY